MVARSRAETLVRPPDDLQLVSAGTPSGTIDLPAKSRGLLVGVGGLLNVTLNGIDHDNVPFQAGTNPGFFERVRAGGTASNIWAIL